jgi:hypothetical protein
VDPVAFQGNDNPGKFTERLYIGRSPCPCSDVAAMTWRPFSKRGRAKDAEAYDALHEGIPDWLKASVCHRIEEVIVTTCNTDDRNTILLKGYDSNDSPTN